MYILFAYEYVHATYYPMMACHVLSFWKASFYESDLADRICDSGARCPRAFLVDRSKDELRGTCAHAVIVVLITLTTIALTVMAISIHA